ncbi:efflux transporter outer membrane subunit [Altererythrobacter sp. SALINAS58]|uniref:efflux transporter outer membrane subunit n=1 Tax=Alteripontixanthobacter muriae TaxID=2705546 RepID=UPI0015758B9C|nr:efflux transporter outer membrane subunit [Alteripontixanthobacter muriae]NTZ44057.1 efflux transporter outer membrane subunit [Alteripontixanthobacter muriae]
MRLRDIAVPSLLLPVLLIGGCASVEPVDIPPSVAAPPYYATNLPPAGPAREWWLGFNDPVLDALIEQGLAANYDVEAAADRLRVAAALLRAERSDRLPGVDGSAEAGVGLGGSGASIDAGAGLFGLFNPDINGRLAAEIRAAVANYAEADYLVSDTRRLVAAAIANQYIEYRRTGAQLELLQESTDLQEQTLRIVTLRFEAGLAANLDVRRAAADLAQTRARRGLIAIARSEAAAALAVLLAEPPGAFLPSDAQLGGIPDYAGGPEAGTPADLLRRRADILAAEARLAQAAAIIGVEQADLRPALTIPGVVSLGNGSLGGLFSDFLLTLGASLDLPLFDGGRRRAEVVAARAEADARLAEYRVTFLNALAEVETSLVAIDAYQQRLASLTEAIEQSEAALGQSNALYREGLASLFDVLDAQRQLIASRQSLIDSEAALASSFVAFHAAIGSDGYQRALN